MQRNVTVGKKFASPTSLSLSRWTVLRQKVFRLSSQSPDIALAASSASARDRDRSKRRRSVIACSGFVISAQSRETGIVDLEIRHVVAFVQRHLADCQH